mmetsp:Transcript_91707/g.273653  ORF Transcript_91707/g.273653 Transcript_91707/m.273653 type:complete len:107 (+) Transcript_91707:777-1097(+)
MAQYPKGGDFGARGRGPRLGKPLGGTDLGQDGEGRVAAAAGRRGGALGGSGTPGGSEGGGGRLGAATEGAEYLGAGGGAFGVVHEPFAWSVVSAAATSMLLSEGAL